jgi:hypothetical protein
MSSAYWDYAESFYGRMRRHVVANDGTGRIEVTDFHDREKRYLNFDNPDAKIKCAYCQQRNDAKRDDCRFCGAPLE